jgi:hypothetical protein
VEGWLFAFGREEALHTRVLGHAARGDDGDDIFDRLTGVGRLTLKRGDYSDAADKGYLTYLLVTEPTGACSHELTRLLRAISKAVGLPGIYDSTIYGSSRASPRSFFPHHLAAISSAIVHTDALVLVNHGSNLSFQLTLPSLAPNAPAGSAGGRRA